MMLFRSWILLLSLTSITQGALSESTDIRTGYRTPPLAPTFSQPPSPRFASCVVDLLGQGDPSINILVVDASTDTPLMSTYTDDLGDWAAHLILPNGTYTVYVVAINDDDEMSSANYSAPFTVIF